MDINKFTKDYFDKQLKIDKLVADSIMVKRCDHKDCNHDIDKYYDEWRENEEAKLFGTEVEEYEQH